MKLTLKGLVTLPLLIILLAVMPVAHFIIRAFFIVMGYLGIGSVLSDGRSLKTPIVFLENPDTGREVVLVGMMHVGGGQYFKDVQGVIDSLSKHRILFEAVGKLSAQERKKLNKREKKILNQFETMSKNSDIFREFIGFQDQRKGLAYDSSWVRTDMDMFALIKKFSHARINPISTGTKKGKLNKFFKGSDSSDRAITKWLLGYLLTLLPLFLILSRLMCFVMRRSRLTYQVIIEERNLIAVNGIARYTEVSNIVSIWGAAHLPGMIKLLGKLGFREVQRKWITVFTRPRLCDALFANQAKLQKAS